VQGSTLTNALALRITVSIFLTMIATVYFSALSKPVAMAAPAPNSWTVATPPSPTGSWATVDYFDGQWIALGNSSEVAISSDGSTWNENAAPSGSWRTLASGNNRLVALSSASASNEEIISTNGIDWTPRPGPSGAWTSLTFGDGRFIAVSSLGRISTSTDGEHWTLVWSHRNYDLTSVAFGDGHFVAVDSALGATLISANGLDWSRILPQLNGLKWGAVAYGNGNFVALDDTSPGYVETSVYGYVWTLHEYAPAQATEGMTFGCGSFEAVGQPTGTTNNILSSSTGATWSAIAVPTDPTSTWTAIAYGAHRFVSVDDTGSIAVLQTTANCAATIPSPPRQISGNVRNGEVWTYMHPAADSGGAPVNSYRVLISNGTAARQCTAPPSFQPNCIIRGLSNREAYTVTTESHNRFGYSAMSDPEFVIPVASPNLSAVTTEAAIAATSAVVVQITGVVANSEGIYPTSLITVHFGQRLVYCHPNPFGECLVTITKPTIGVEEIYASYTGYGRSYQSPVSHVKITP
jgi:hypothetical protein